MRGGAEASSSQAYIYFDDGCRRGSAMGCGNAAAMRVDGQGVPKDLALAKELGRKGCELGNANSCNNLGVALRDAGGSPAEALSFLDKACAAGQALGCFNAGKSLDEGIGMPADEKKAASYFAKACELGHREACGKAPGGALSKSTFEDPEVGVPPDCEESRTGDGWVLLCPTTIVSASAYAGEDIQAEAERAHAEMTAIMIPSPGEVEKHSCEVQGVSTTCLRTRERVPRDQVGIDSTVLAMVTAAGKDWFAQCTYTYWFGKGMGDTENLPCAKLITSGWKP